MGVTTRPLCSPADCRSAVAMLKVRSVLTYRSNDSFRTIKKSVSTNTIAVKPVTIYRRRGTCGTGPSRSFGPSGKSSSTAARRWGTARSAVRRSGSTPTAGTLPFISGLAALLRWCEVVDPAKVQDVARGLYVGDGR